MEITVHAARGICLSGNIVHLIIKYHSAYKDHPRDIIHVILTVFMVLCSYRILSTSSIDLPITIFSLLHNINTYMYPSIEPLCPPHLRMHTSCMHARARAHAPSHIHIHTHDPDVSPPPDLAPDRHTILLSPPPSVQRNADQSAVGLASGGVEARSCGALLGLYSTPARQHPRGPKHCASYRHDTSWAAPVTHRNKPQPNPTQPDNTRLVPPDLHHHAKKVPFGAFAAARQMRGIPLPAVSSDAP